MNNAANTAPKSRKARLALASLCHRQARKLERKADGFCDHDSTARNPECQRFVDYLNDRAVELRHRGNALRAYRG